MEDILQVDQVQQANDLVGKDTRHPLVTVIDFSKEKPMRNVQMTMDLYGIFLKTGREAEVKYGRSSYDYQNGTLLAIGPGQLVGLNATESGDTFQPRGWGLMFHPDLIKGTALGKNIRGYSFFSYSVREALHLSAQERDQLLACFQKIADELQHAIDKHSRSIVVSAIELLLNYCQRYYDRQVITREITHQGLIERLDRAFDSYFSSDLAQSLSFPTVSHLAEQLHLSANYFGDLVKKETGKNAKEYIQWKLTDRAKELMLDPEMTATEIAYSLGFKYPQHFTRFFKQQVGMTPREYREAVN